jgi:hypothetical protein
LSREFWRLPAFDNPLDELGREKGQTHQPADVLLADTFPLGWAAQKQVLGFAPRA